MSKAIYVAVCLLCLLCVPLIAQEELTRPDLIQPFLDKYAQWMMGAIPHLATEDEIFRFGSLETDEEAEDFIRSFWASRASSKDGPSLQELYEGRAVFADDEYTQGHVSGRRTDRGTIYILYGPPESTEHEELRDISEPDIELWRYPKKAEKGLDGEKPKRQYRFARQGDLTRIYHKPSTDELRRRARMRKPF